MYITLDILQKRGACQEFIDFFAKHHPDGVEMLEMIERGHLPYHALHWGYKWLDPNEEEVAAYYKKIAVERSEGVDESDHITDSQIVANSSRVTNSHHIYGSEDITDCEYVVDSTFVYSSASTYSSNFVDVSYFILGGQNVNNSNQVVDSSYVMNSHGVYMSNNIVECHTIWNSNNLTNCNFCFGCENMTNAMFCSNAKDGEYYLFNKPIDKARFDMIFNQYKRYSSLWMTLTDGWPTNKDHPKKLYDYRKHLPNIPESFWSWVRTLPGYDPMIMYSITFNPRFLV